MAETRGLFWKTCCYMKEYYGLLNTWEFINCFMASGVCLVMIVCTWCTVVLLVGTE